MIVSAFVREVVEVIWSVPPLNVNVLAAPVLPKRLKVLMLRVPAFMVVPPLKLLLPLVKVHSPVPDFTSETAPVPLFAIKAATVLVATLVPVRVSVRVWFVVP
jgi:hypothetical protein